MMNVLFSFAWFVIVTLVGYHRLLESLNIAHLLYPKYDYEQWL
jgi:hypothetical protein